MPLTGLSNGDVVVVRLAEPTHDLEVVGRNLDSCANPPKPRSLWSRRPGHGLRSHGNISDGRHAIWKPAQPVICGHVAFK